MPDGIFSYLGVIAGFADNTLRASEKSRMRISPRIRKTSMWLAGGVLHLARLPISIVNMLASSGFTLKYGRC